MTEQNRAAPRIQSTFRVDYVDANGGAWWGMASDFSRNGMFLKHSPGLARGDIVTLFFNLPTDHACKLQAVVIRTTKVGSGLRFMTRNRNLEAYFNSMELQEGWRDWRGSQR